MIQLAVARTLRHKLSTGISDLGDGGPGCPLLAGKIMWDVKGLRATSVKAKDELVPSE